MISVLLNALWLACMALLGTAMTAALGAQTVQPVVAEYTGTAEGTFVVTNTSYVAAAVLLEPQSFTIDAEGKGLYRPLDGGIHVDLSKTSLRLGPRESQTIFYKITSDILPAWLTIYATFAPLHPSPGVNVHIMLPHTVYLYSKQRLRRNDILVNSSTYDGAAHTVQCQVSNIGRVVGRASQLRISSGHNRVGVTGFPLLPGGTRRVSIPWTRDDPPRLLTVNFDGFVLKQEITAAPEHR